MLVENFNLILSLCFNFIFYLQPKYKDAAAFTVKYRLCLCKAVQLIKTYVSNAIQTATQQVLDSKQSSKEGSNLFKLRLVDLD